MKKFKLIYFNTLKGERAIYDIQELYEALIELRDSAPTPESINLISPNGDILTVAIGREFGFVQFENALPDSPYLIAVDKQNQITTENYRDVDAGGTPTPIPGYACLPPEKVIEIALHYFKHLTIPNYIEWEEI
jgi:hypothetical protein